MKYVLLLTFSTIALASEFRGVITDSMCGTDHKAMKITPDPKCVEECKRMAAGVRYVLFDGKKTYKLSDQETPGRFAAQRVKVSGTLFEKTGVIKVDKIDKD